MYLDLTNFCSLNLSITNLFLPLGLTLMLILLFLVLFMDELDLGQQSKVKHKEKEQQQEKPLINLCWVQVPAGVKSKDVRLRTANNVPKRNPVFLIDFFDVTGATISALTIVNSGVTTSFYINGMIYTGIYTGYLSSPVGPLEAVSVTPDASEFARRKSTHRILSIVEEVNLDNNSKININKLSYAVVSHAN